jgi:hypothetical protein
MASRTIAGLDDSSRYVVGDLDYGAWSPVEFTLRYKGPLVADGSPIEKHRIRQALHPQLANLWKQHPLLSDAATVLLVGNDGGKFVKATRVEWISLNHRRGQFRFVPLVSGDLNLVCNLDIQFLRREPPGALVRHGGDIDNRLKTLFDAMRVPDEAQVSKAAPQPGEQPFYCLLEDDALITGFCVTTQRLLDQLGDDENPKNVALNINVKVSTTLASEDAAFSRLRGVYGLAKP